MDFAEIEAPGGRRLAYLPEPWVEPFLRTVLEGREYPPLPFNSFAPSVIFDIGAHIGAAALYFAHRYPSALIHCFEPNPRTLPVLHHNVAAIGQVTVHDYGLGAQARTANLYDGVHSTMQVSFLPNRENTQHAATAPIRDVASVLADALVAPSLVKLDTEGMELEILNALSDHLSSIGVLYVEYHSDADRRAIDALLGTGFSLFHASVAEPDRGIMGFVSVRLLEALRAREKAPQFAWPKPAAQWS
jgi:FkbM family methyltransferase